MKISISRLALCFYVVFAMTGVVGAMISIMLGTYSLNHHIDRGAMLFRGILLGVSAALALYAATSNK